MRLMKFEVKLEQLKLHEKNCLLNFVFLFDTVAQVWGRSTCVRDGEANHHGDHDDDRDDVVSRRKLSLYFVTVISVLLKYKLYT